MAGTPPPGPTPFAAAVVATSAVVMAVALFGAAFLMGPALLMGLLALVLATAALPVVDGLGRFLPRPVAALVVLAAGLVGLVAAIAFAVPDLTAQFGLLLEHLPGVGYVPPQAGYLAWLDFNSLGLGADPAKLFLHRGRVALSPGPTFGVR